MLIPTCLRLALVCAFFCTGEDDDEWVDRALADYLAASCRLWVVEGGCDNDAKSRSRLVADYLLAVVNLGPLSERGEGGS
jgi:hypothetical protein